MTVTTYSAVYKTPSRTLLATIEWDKHTIKTLTARIHEQRPILGVPEWEAEVAHDLRGHRRLVKKMKAAAAEMMTIEGGDFVSEEHTEFSPENDNK